MNLMIPAPMSTAVSTAPGETLAGSFSAVVTAAAGLLVLLGLVVGWGAGTLGVLIAAGTGRYPGTEPQALGVSGVSGVSRCRRVAVAGLVAAGSGATGFLILSLPVVVSADQWGRAGVAVLVAAGLTVGLRAGLGRLLRRHGGSRPESWRWSQRACPGHQAQRCGSGVREDVDAGRRT